MEGGEGEREGGNREGVIGRGEGEGRGERVKGMG